MMESLDDERDDLEDDDEIEQESENHQPEIIIGGPVIGIIEVEPTVVG